MKELTSLEKLKEVLKSLSAEELKQSLLSQPKAKMGMTIDDYLKLKKLKEDGVNISFRAFRKHCNNKKK